MKEIYVCQGRWCSELDSGRVLAKVKKKLAPVFGKKQAKVCGCRCTGYCEQGVSVVVGDQVIHEVTEDNVFDKLADKNEYHSLHTIPTESDVEDDFLGDI